MRLLFVVICIFGTLITPSVAAASPDDGAMAARRGLAIRVEGNGWGNVDSRQIQTVLQAVADTLTAQLPQTQPVAVVVMHTDGHPIALYDRGPAGEYRVNLHARATYWHLYVYEFAHEFCHVLANYTADAGANTGRSNQWFEESLCEAASLYALEHLAETWERSPPTPEWSAQAGKLRQFFNVLIKEQHRQLQPQTALVAWLRNNEEGLRNNPYLREKNDLLAKMLLPLFKRNPQNWDALRYLNLDPADANVTLAVYLRHWYNNAPSRHKAFIGDILQLLGNAAPDSIAG